MKPSDWIEAEYERGAQGWYGLMMAIIAYLDAEYERQQEQVVRDTTPLPPPPLPAIFCEHPNEVPHVCPCDPDCYCRTHTCEPLGPRGSTTPAPPPGANGPSER